MCGIVGIFSFDSKIECDTVKKMTDSIIHRGPDGEGHWINASGRIALGHRRLSIIDLTENGKQPMQYSNGRYTITFNGEIYNYIELRRILKLAGYLFTSNSDTEVLLALYDQKKENCLTDLDGMFAFAIWDEEEQKLFCARDRFGEKPFYYHFSRNNFYFSSEMKSLWSVGVEKKINKLMMLNFITNNIVVDENEPANTFYDNIYQLDNAQYLTITNDYFEPVKKYYYSLDPIKVNKIINEKEAKDQFISLLEESVRLRLRSDVPVGSSLSGGIDSSSIVLLIDKIKGEFNVQKTFSARFNNFDRDEGYFMKLVTDKCKNIESNEVWPTNDEMELVIEKILYHQEEPFGSASIFAQWKVMELAKSSGVSVLLDGQGADEQLAGYLYYYNLYLAQLYQNNYPVFLKEVEAYENLRNLKHILHPRSQSMKMQLGQFKRRIVKSSKSISETHLNNSLKHDMVVTGLKELLRYADRNSMAHSVEVRLPFLSHKLVEFVFTLPDSFKLKEGWTKMILRESMANILPFEITWRIDKVAYETPQEQWIEDIKESPIVKKRILPYLNDLDYFKKGYKIEDIPNWNYYLLTKFIK